MRPRTWILIVVLLATVAMSRHAPLSAAGGAGSLRVDSEPAGAVVYIDGRQTGETPLTLDTLPEGVHRVRLVRSGYLDNVRLVTIKSGARADVRTQLTAAPPV